MAEFSIIVPVYNTENYIEKCLRSVLNQTSGDFECIIVDDGSRDGSISIAEKLISGDARFRIIHQENGGLSAARNSGIRAAQGQWLVFLDSDDFLHADALKRLTDTLNAASETPDVIISSTYAYYEETHSATARDWNPTNPAFRGNLMKAAFLSPYFIVAAWTLSVRRDYLIGNGLWFEPSLLHEDELWFPQTLGLSEHTVVNSSSFYYNRCGRRGSIVNNKNSKKLTDKLYIIQALKDKFQSDNRLSKYMDSILYRRAQIFLSIIRDSGLYHDEQIYDEIRRGSEVLLEAKNPKYAALWLALKALGPRRMSDLLRRWSGL